MKKTFLMILAAFLFPAAAMADNPWGALAFNKSTRAIGYSWNHYTPRNARRAARRQCGYRCVILTTFRNSCVAMAIGDRAYGWATHPNRYRARIRARRQCRRYGGRYCRIRVTKCSYGRHFRR